MTAFKDATGEAKLTTKGDLREMEHRINGELKLLERATKGDLREMEHRINGELKLLKWMLTALLAANMAVLIKFFSA